MRFDFNVLVFALSVAAILLTPGPTNTLLAVAGLAQGARRASPLVVFELCGYLAGISAWGMFLTSAQHHCPWLGSLVRVVSSCYLVYVAVRLWLAARERVENGPRAIGPRALFVATLLNPKGLLFASVIFPPNAFEDRQTYLATMGLFACLLLPIGFVWIKFGAALSKGCLFNPLKLQRVAALVIGMFSATIAWSAFH